MNGSQESLSIGKENGCIVEGSWENFQFAIFKKIFLLFVIPTETNSPKAKSGVEES